MFTIDFCDGNGFLARQRRQSASPSRTREPATFLQQFAYKAVNPADPRASFAQH
jgi:hypothetical protein